MNTEELKIVQDVYSLGKVMNEVIINFPKEYKYSYGEELRNLIVKMLTEITMANYNVNNLGYRALHLEQTMGYFETIKIIKRWCVDTKCIPLKRLSEVDLLLGEIGRQLMGWFKKYEKYLGIERVGLE